MHRIPAAALQISHAYGATVRPEIAGWSHETHGRLVPALVRDPSSPTRRLRTRSGPSSTRNRPFGAAASVCFAGRLPAAAAPRPASTAPSLRLTRGGSDTRDAAPTPRQCRAKAPTMSRENPGDVAGHPTMTRAGLRRRRAAKPRPARGGLRSPRRDAKRMAMDAPRPPALSAGPVAARYNALAA